MRIRDKPAVVTLSFLGVGLSVALNTDVQRLRGGWWLACCSVFRREGSQRAYGFSRSYKYLGDSENLMRDLLTREPYLPTKVTCDFEDSRWLTPMNHPIEG